MTVSALRFTHGRVQIGGDAAFSAIPYLNKAEITLVSGNFLAFNAAGVPLGDPLAALQVLVSTLSHTGPMLIGALLTLLLAVIMGPVFCSWLCPYGLLSEVVNGCGRNNVAAAGSKDREPGAAAPPAASNVPKQTRTGPSSRPFLSRLAVVGVGLLLVAFLVPFPLLNQLSMPGWYSRSLQHLALYHNVILGGVFFLAGMLLIERLAAKRLWCRYFCPQSVLISLAGLILPFRFRILFKRTSCTCPASDRPCLRSCSLELDPRSGGSLSQRAQCTNCGDCVDACRSRGRALHMGFSSGKNKITGKKQ